MEQLDSQEITVTCEECSDAMPADSPALRIELADDSLLIYCEVCWEREFG